MKFNQLTKLEAKLTSLVDRMERVSGVVKKEEGNELNGEEIDIEVKSNLSPHRMDLPPHVEQELDKMHKELQNELKDENSQIPIEQTQAKSKPRGELSGGPPVLQIQPSSLATVVETEYSGRTSPAAPSSPAVHNLAPGIIGTSPQPSPKNNIKAATASNEEK